MYYDNKILIGKADDKDIYIYPKMANRHGMIAGATGTGKTVSLRVIAESFSNAGVPVFLADIKGDLAGMCKSGNDSEDMQERIARFGLAEKNFSYSAFPVTFWDVYARMGLPMRTTITEMGPLLLSRILDLNDTQTDILKIIFKIADDEGLLLIDTKDLRAMINYVGENAKDYSMAYGNMAKQSLAAIIRAVVSLESEGADKFFGEPAFSINDCLATDCNGHGNIQIMDCQELINYPTMYSTFLLWLLSELYETLPEVGDREKPKLVFFFDEAHLLFNTATKALLEKIEQLVKLIRSKGVSIFFVTQNPQDIPDGVLSQLGNKVQHCLHAYTPSEQKAVRIAAQSYRVNPAFDTGEAITELGIGEALVSVLDEDGVPTIVERTKILPPQSRMGAITPEERTSEINASLLFTKYSEEIDRDSAYEFLMRKNLEEEAAALAQKEAEEKAKAEEAAEKERLKQEAAEEKERQKQEAAEEKERLRQEAAEEKERQKQEAAEERARLKAEAAAEKERLKAEAKAEKEAAAKQDAMGKAVKKAAKNAASSAAGTIGREVGNSLGKSMGGSIGKKVGGNVGASLGRGILSTLFRL